MSRAFGVAVLLAVTGWASGCGGTSAGAAIGRCLSQHGLVFKQRKQQLAVMASEPSEVVSFLSTDVHGRLIEMWLPKGGTQMNDAEAYLSAVIKNHDDVPATSWGLGGGGAAQYGTILVGWSSAPSRAERAAMDACLRTRGASIVLPP